jgi:hypothetical protein
MTRPFVDNFIFFDSYPVNKISVVAQWLSNSNLDRYYRADDFAHNAKHYEEHNFHGITQIVFPDYVFADNNASPDWKGLCNVIRPLVEFMYQQISKFGRFRPKHVEINIMPPGSQIKKHCDDMEGVGSDYRMHLVLCTNDSVEFTVEDKSRHLPQGTCFAFDNSKAHEVVNRHAQLTRIHLVIDFELF